MLTSFKVNNYLLILFKIIEWTLRKASIVVGTQCLMPTFLVEMYSNYQ